MDQIEYFASRDDKILRKEIRDWLAEHPGIKIREHRLAMAGSGVSMGAAVSILYDDGKNPE